VDLTAGLDGRGKSRSPPRFDPRNVQPVASRYTDRAIPDFAPCNIGGLGVACWPLVPKFAGSKQAKTVRFFRAKKILSTTSFGGEVKPSVPCRRFAACKRSLN
jgi:hypothetical protein